MKGKIFIVGILLVSGWVFADDVYYWVEKEARNGERLEVSGERNNSSSSVTRNPSPVTPQIRYLNTSQDTVKVIIKR